MFTALRYRCHDAFDTITPLTPLMLMLFSLLLS